MKTAKLTRSMILKAADGRGLEYALYAGDEVIVARDNGRLAYVKVAERSQAEYPVLSADLAY
jgi:carbohydrate-binding DOMON domain-containing protein